MGPLQGGWVQSGLVGHNMAPLRVDGTSRKVFPPLPVDHRDPQKQGRREFLPRCYISDTKICSPTVLQICCVTYPCAHL